MGRDWLHWGAGSAGGGRPSSSSSSSARQRMAPEDTTPGGCMCAVFHLFDLHPFQFPLNHPQPDSANFLSQETISSKGIEAPRNSLETQAAAEIQNQEQDLNFPGVPQIKTRVSIKARAEEVCSSSSPGATTPSLVARLMGLEVLPQCSSPSSSRPPKKSHFKKRDILGRRSGRSFSDDDISVGVRSMPETPRMSLARRSDVECPRLSLNVNKENVGEDFGTRKRRGRFRPDEDRSPGHYAKQIVNHVRESVGRRFGIDITNMNRDADVIRRDENLILHKSNKNHFKVLPSLESETRPDGGKPAVRFSDIKKNKQVPNSDTKSPRCHKGISDPLKSNSQIIVQEHYQQRKRRNNGSRITSSDQAIRSKKEEHFVHSRAATTQAHFTDKKSRKAPLSSELLNASGPTLLPVKKAPSHPATKLPQKQTQASDALTSKRNTQLCNSKKSHSYKQLHLQPVNAAADSNNRCGGAGSAAEYRHYIQRILKRTGIIDGVTPLILGKWHAPSHPLDPSIFYYLELFHPRAASAAVLSSRCNRKLIFQLVDELLAEILKPQMEFIKPRGSHTTDQSTLVDDLCTKIEAFPAANCQVLEDIDSLIDGDLCNRNFDGFSDEETAKLRHEIEDAIMDWLLQETAETLGVRTEEYPGQESRGIPRDQMPLAGPGIIHVDNSCFGVLDSPTVVT